MVNTLKSFVDKSLFEATSDLLAKLRVQFDRETAHAYDFSEFYEGSMPKYIQEATSLLSATYFIGVINDLSLQGQKEATELSEVAEIVEHGGKYDGMFVFACEVKPEANMTRSTAAVLTRAFNRIASANPVILVLRQGKSLSLATCERMEYSQAWRNGQGEKLGKVSILRNVNCENPHRGHVDILESIGDKAYPTFEELYKHWMEVFSNELLTKKFYNELSDWYAWAVMVAKFPNDLNTTADDEKYNHEACIRLITRLIFVWFLKQKHLIPEEFFDEKYIKENFIENFDPHDKDNIMYKPSESKYYRLVLQNLFFAMLNCPIVAEGKTTANNRRFIRESFQGKNPDYGINNLMRYKKEFMEGGSEKFLKFANSCVPFLNGGLFDCLDNKVSKIFYDGFSEEQKSLEQLSLPDYLFFGEEVGNGIDLSQWYDDNRKKNVSARGIIDILKRYSFTIEENTPYDQEVSLDPELLGKVFENLLAAYNPETKQSARKQTGSFYTPREIVQYMVDESLVAHLKRLCGDELENEYRKLVNYADVDVDITDEQRSAIMKALYNCRVLDPACGSGAFPMGVLQQMVHILKRIDPTNELWNDLMIDLALADAKKEFKKAAGNEAERAKAEENKNARLADIEEAFNQNINDPDYARKLYLIEHCIYGVDIQPIATQISKLRFFISLVADQKPTSDAKTNFGIRPLPNLEAKFVTANTLIPLDREENLFTASQEIRDYEEQLQEINHRIFLAKKNKDKERLRELMHSIRTMMAHVLENQGFVSTKGFDQLVNWNMFDQNASAPFFDPEWMFQVNDGFDIVIGNPPYIRLQSGTGVFIKKNNKDVELKLADLYDHLGYYTFSRSGDMYCLFYELAIKMLSHDGIMCFITSNKWLKSGYGDLLRNYLCSQTQPLQLIDFAGYKVFENATVDTTILITQKTQLSSATQCFKMMWGCNSLRDLSALKDRCVPIIFHCNEMWNILTPTEQSIKARIEQMGRPLSTWNININYGIKTGLGKAYVITSEEREAILSSCISEEEKQRTKSIICPFIRGKDVFRYGYSWANLWLINFHNGVRGLYPRLRIEDYPAIKRHLDKYYDNLINRSDKGDTAYNLRNCAYLEDFNHRKIVWTPVNSEYKFTVVPEGVVFNNSLFMITGDNIELICAFANSKVLKYYLSLFSGDNYQYGSSDYFSSLPIPILSDCENELITQYVNNITKAVIEGLPYDSFEDSIESLIMDYYNFSEEEKLIILNNQSLHMI